VVTGPATDPCCFTLHCAVAIVREEEKESSSVFSRPRPSRKRPRVETQGLSEHSGIKKGWFLELVPLSNERLHVEIVISQTIKYQSLS
jgi:hypothetical protein